MKTKVVYVEREPSSSVSIEKVFRQIAKNLDKEKFTASFQQLLYGNDEKGTIKNLLFFKKPSADIYHITGHIHYIALVLPKNRTILTIHDVGILFIRKGFRRYILKKLLLDLPIKKLKYITAVSETTKKQIIEHTNCPPEKIRVIENPLQEHFQPKAKNPFNTKCPTILQIGTAYNKNLNNLIKSLKGINCRLRIIGEVNAEIKNLLEINGINFENALNLSNEAMRDEYQKTDLVTFCSTFEGFGLPIIEAQAMLTPVITSNISPMKEVAGDSAALADPFNFVSIREGILKIINNAEYRNELVEAGVENIKRFQPATIALQYENLYVQMKAEF